MSSVHESWAVYHWTSTATKCFVENTVRRHSSTVNVLIILLIYITYILVLTDFPARRNTGVNSGVLAGWQLKPRSSKICDNILFLTFLDCFNRLKLWVSNSFISSSVSNSKWIRLNTALPCPSDTWIIIGFLVFASCAIMVWSPGKKRNVVKDQHSQGFQ